MKKLICLLTATLMVVCFAVTSFAAKKTAIKAVSVTVSGKIYAGQRAGDEEITVTAGGGNYSLDHYDILNEVFEWEGGETPEITVYLTAKEGYYFGLTKASQIQLRRCTYKTASRQDSSTTLAVTVTLDKVGNKVDEPEECYITENALCSWPAVDNAGSYEVRFLRESAALGGTHTVGKESLTEVDYGGNMIPGYKFDGSQYLTKEGTYRFKVRAIHKDDPEIKSGWAESSEIYISEQEAKKNKEAYDAAISAGDWIQDAQGYKFRLPDGTFVANAWRQIHGEWYYFKGDGYAATGWIQLDGSWYCFDETSCAMLKNTTKDGYTIGIDGRCSEK